MPKIRSLNKIPKRKVTVDEILNVSDIVDIASDLNDLKYDIEDVLVVYTKSDGNTICWRTNGMSASHQIYFLECVKGSILRNDA